MNNPAPGGTRRYRINPWSLALIWSMAGGVTLAVVVTLLSDPKLCTSDKSVACGLALFLLLLNGGAYWLTSYTRLLISAAGVTVRNLGITVQTTWANVISVRVEPGGVGLFTAEPMEGGGAARLSLMSGFAATPGVPMFDRTGQQMRQERRYIPLEPFAWHLRHGDLAAEVDRFAPQLGMRAALAAAEAARRAPKPPRTTEERRQRRRLWVGLLLTYGAVGGLVWLLVAVPTAAKIFFGVGFVLLFPFCAWTMFRIARNSFRAGQTGLGIFCCVVGLVPLSPLFIGLAAIWKKTHSVRAVALSILVPCLAVYLPFAAWKVCQRARLRFREGKGLRGVLLLGAGFLLLLPDLFLAWAMLRTGH